MKNNIIKLGMIASLALVGGTVTSCRDAVDIVQEGELTEDVLFTSVNNLERYLIGDVYTELEPATKIYATSVLTDEVRLGSKSGGQELEEYNGLLTASSALASTAWLDNYQLINKVNRLLKGAEQITPSASETARYNKILAEARTLRALAYLELLTLFSEDMSDENALGVIIVEGVPTISTKLPRNTNKEVYAVIEKDLEFAGKYLSRTDSYKRVTLNLVDAITARLNLYRGKYAEAKIAAESLLDNSNLVLTKATAPNTGVGTDIWNENFYAETSSDDYRNIWTDKLQGEVIFSVSRTERGSGVALSSYYNTNTSDISGSPKWSMGKNLFTILDKTKGDIRRYAYVDPTSILTGNEEEYIIDKYPGKGTAATRNDIKLFRLSEVYFILAEVAVWENNLLKAKEYIQKVREARNYEGSAETPTYNSKEEAYADILKERRVELAFEGHRLIDMKRLASLAGVKMDRTEKEEEKRIIPTYKYTLPIPLVEIAGNPGIQQNSEYR